MFEMIQVYRASVVNKVSQALSECRESSDTSKDMKTDMFEFANVYRETILSIIDEEMAFTRYDDSMEVIFEQEQREYYREPVDIGMIKVDVVDCVKLMDPGTWSYNFSCWLDNKIKTDSLIEVKAGFYVDEDELDGKIEEILLDLNKLYTDAQKMKRICL